MNLFYFMSKRKIVFFCSFDLEINFIEKKKTMKKLTKKLTSCLSFGSLSYFFCLKIFGFMTKGETRLH